jgi:hypothetical protein
MAKYDDPGRASICDSRPERDRALAGNLRRLLPEATDREPTRCNPQVALFYLFDR